MRVSERTAVAAAAGLAVTALAYAVLRAVDVVFFPEANPATILWSARSGFVWRAVASLYVGGMGAFGGYALAARAPDAAARWLGRLLMLAAAAIAAAGALLP